MKDGHKVVALLLIGGKGERLSKDEYKQFILVEGKPLFMYAYETLIGHPDIDEIAIVTLSGTEEKVEEIISNVNSKKPHYIISGKETRAASSLEGLKLIKSFHDDNEIIVLIHDGDRPLVNDRIISENIQKVSKTSPVCTILEINDALIGIDSKKDAKPIYLDRNKHYLVQTPETFGDIEKLISSYEKALKSDLTPLDDTSAMGGENVTYVRGDALNFKVTTIGDLERLQFIVKSR